VDDDARSRGVPRGGGWLRALPPGRAQRDPVHHRAAAAGWPARARRAADADRDLLHAWHDAFLAELGSTSIRDVPAQVTDRLGYGGLVLWEAGGVPVSMAGRTQVTAGICKVAPVYTPPRQRGHGYGTAATAAVTRHAIEAGARGTAIHRRHQPGLPATRYRPAEDRLILTFT
jgi:hypothetical protein